MFWGKFTKYSLFIQMVICLFLLSNITAFAKPVLIDSILAVINGEIITRSDLILREKRLYEARNFSKDFNADEIKEFREKILNNLINERLMIKEAERM
jgi:hypothetical protein